MQKRLHRKRFCMVCPTGFEPTIYRVGVCCIIQLCYGQVFYFSTSDVYVPFCIFISPVRLISYEVLDIEDRFIYILVAGNSSYNYALRIANCALIKYYTIIQKLSSIYSEVSSSQLSYAFSSSDCFSSSCCVSSVSFS